MKQPIITNQITALYERLSRDDELSGDSVSIQTQKFFLEDYAKQHGFVPFAHYTDDGFSGGNFNRPSWNRLVADVEAGKVSAVIVKDMSRVGREYLQTGYYTEIFFPQNHVRFIAVSNNIDSNDRNSSEIAPFLNVINDFYLRDCSHKQKPHTKPAAMPVCHMLPSPVTDTERTPPTGTIGSWMRKRQRSSEKSFRLRQKGSASSRSLNP